MRLLSYIFFTFILTGLCAQDIQFSQFYVTPLYLGPSFAGTSEGTRIVTNFRDQWPQVDNGMVAYSFAVDQYFVNSRSAIGIMYYGDLAGESGLSLNSYSAQYSYTINVKQKLVFRPGLQVSYERRSINYNKLVFGDQLTFFENKENTIEDLGDNKHGYLDFAASLLGYYKKIWFGFTAHHINMPNQSFMDGVSKVPVKYTLYMGAQHNLKRQGRVLRDEKLYSNIMFQRQGDFNQLVLGAYWEKEPLTIGLSYRGLPFEQTYENNRNNDAIIIMVGFIRDFFRVAYSFDFTTSGLISDTSGAHEITVSYVFKNNRQFKQKHITVPCPRF